MKVFKFGGASVKDAEGVKNVAQVLESEGFHNCMLIVSAMGKTTNALENVVDLYIQHKDYKEAISGIKNYHFEIIKELFSDENSIFFDVNELFISLLAFLEKNKSDDQNYIYDQTVSFGELISSKILSDYLNLMNYSNEFLDAAAYIKTNNDYREGAVNWSETEFSIGQLDQTKCYVTQGFIGSSTEKNMVTLGREGSDYSAAIFAYCLNAESLTIWKDVAGVMTGDPRKFKNAKLLSYISYEEAIEMAYYGASIIHPKTLQPLKQKNIPFYVKSFYDPAAAGTKVSVTDKNVKEETYILKEKQHLIHISTKDFSFIAENHIGLIFEKLSRAKIKVSMMQNSAISLALCLDDTYDNFDLLTDDLGDQFRLEIIKNVSLFTIRNIQLKNASHFFDDKEVLLEQISSNTLQIIAR